MPASRIAKDTTSHKSPAMSLRQWASNLDCPTCEDARCLGRPNTEAFPIRLLALAPKISGHVDRAYA
jgi:hypothetical protein